MSKILADSRLNVTVFSFEPGYAQMQTMRLQAGKRSNSQADMNSLRDFKAILGLFNTGELIETAMINFPLPGIRSMKEKLIDESTDPINPGLEAVRSSPELATIPTPTLSAEFLELALATIHFSKSYSFPQLEHTL